MIIDLSSWFWYDSLLFINSAYTSYISLLANYCLEHSISTPTPQQCCQELRSLLTLPNPLYQCVWLSADAGAVLQPHGATCATQLPYHYITPWGKGRWHIISSSIKPAFLTMCVTSLHSIYSLLTEVQKAFKLAKSCSKDNKPTPNKTWGAQKWQTCLFICVHMLGAVIETQGDAGAKYSMSRTRWKVNKFGPSACVHIYA